MRNIWHDIDPHAITPTHFTAVIEIPAGSKKKYELDKKTGLLRLDRILYTSTHYPANYGFIPRTYADDGDPLDVLVFCSETLDPMVEVDCYPIGTMRMIDGDAIDDKIIAVPFQDPTWNFYKDISEIRRTVPARFRTFSRSTRRSSTSTPRPRTHSAASRRRRSSAAASSSTKFISAAG